MNINLDDYEGYNKGGKKDLRTIDNELMPLFNHSDCGGRLTVKECKSIVKGLNKILENFNKEIESDYNFKDNVLKFRDGCLEAISDKKNGSFLLGALINPITQITIRLNTVNRNIIKKQLWKKTEVLKNY